MKTHAYFQNITVLPRNEEGVNIVRCNLAMPDGSKFRINASYTGNTEELGTQMLSSAVKHCQKHGVQFDSDRGQAQIDLLLRRASATATTPRGNLAMRGFNLTGDEDAD